MDPMSTLRIGDMARLGGVSVRMLRHYHELGLLEPAEIDEWTGHRSYHRSQLATLQEIVRLRRFGLPLARIAEVTEPSATIEQLQQVLLDRQRELASELADGQQTLAELEAHLTELTNTTTQETTMTTSGTTAIEVEIKSEPARLVAQLSAIAESWAPEDIGPTIQPLYPELMARMEKAGVAIAGPSTAWYADTEDGKIQVHATLTIAERPDGDAESLGFEVVELPALSKVASTIHTGTMDDCDRTYDALLEWVESNGHRAVGYSREIDIECEPDKPWIVELQLQLEG